MFCAYRARQHSDPPKATNLWRLNDNRAYLQEGRPENPKAKRQQTNLSNTDNWFISFSPLASFFLEDEHYGRIHCKFHFFSSAQKH